MCERCYQEWERQQRTQPHCERPRHGGMTRQSGWLCGTCGHWHPYPEPPVPYQPHFPTPTS